MYAKTKLTLALGVINLMFVATSQAGVVRDESGKGWGERRETGNAPSTSPEIANPTSISPFLKMVPGGKGWGEHPDAGNAASKGARTTSNGINYRGGPLILGTTNVYYIWYGNWSGNTALTILNNFASSIGTTTAAIVT